MRTAVLLLESSSCRCCNGGIPVLTVVEENGVPVCLRSLSQSNIGFYGNNSSIVKTAKSQNPVPASSKASMDLKWPISKHTSDEFSTNNTQGKSAAGTLYSSKCIKGDRTVIAKSARSINSGGSDINSGGSDINDTTDNEIEPIKDIFPDDPIFSDAKNTTELVKTSSVVERASKSDNISQRNVAKNSDLFRTTKVAKDSRKLVTPTCKIVEESVLKLEFANTSTEEEAEKELPVLSDVRKCGKDVKGNYQMETNDTRKHAKVKTIRKDGPTAKNSKFGVAENSKSADTLQSESREARIDGSATSLAPTTVLFASSLTETFDAASSDSLLQMHSPAARLAAQQATGESADLTHFVNTESALRPPVDGTGERTAPAVLLESPKSSTSPQHQRQTSSSPDDPIPEPVDAGKSQERQQLREQHNQRCLDSSIHALISEKAIELFELLEMALSQRRQCQQSNHSPVSVHNSTNEQAGPAVLMKSDSRSNNRVHARRSAVSVALLEAVLQRVVFDEFGEEGKKGSK